MCDPVSIAAIAGTALSAYESTKGPKKTGQPKPPPDLEKEREETRKRGARARARASGGFGTQDTFGYPGSTGQKPGTTLLGG